ncbi:MAG: ketoacyl-synthetase C-terminal extension domain-containing protein, partial [Verrucomicrobiota bacterium]
NPQIDFANSPFTVQRQLSDWPCNGTPRRAGVSSFGMGGTNAHVILEEAPELKGAAQLQWSGLGVLARRWRLPWWREGSK